MSGDGVVFNSYMLAEAIGIPYARPITGRGTGWAWAGDFWGDDAWDKMVAASGHPRWVRAGGGLNDWFPEAAIEAAKAAGVKRREGRALIWSEPGRPCEEGMGERCGRPATATRPQRRHGAPEGSVVWICAFHQKAYAKRTAAEEERSRNWQESRERDRRRREHQQLAEELLEWAGPLLGELGIHPKTITAGSIGDRTGLLLPAEAVATLIEEAIGERYPGRSDAASSTTHPTTTSPRGENP